MEQRLIMFLTPRERDLLVFALEKRINKIRKYCKRRSTNETRFYIAELNEYRLLASNLVAATETKQTERKPR